MHHYLVVILTDHATFPLQIFKPRWQTFTSLSYHNECRQALSISMIISS